MNDTQCENLKEKTDEHLNEILRDEKNELLRTISEKNERIAYLNALIEAYEECMQKFAALVRKIQKDNQSMQEEGQNEND